jgi:hypothetical protein
LTRWIRIWNQEGQNGLLKEKSSLQPRCSLTKAGGFLEADKAFMQFWKKKCMTDSTGKHFFKRFLVIKFVDPDPVSAESNKFVTAFKVIKPKS